MEVSAGSASSSAHPALPKSSGTYVMQTKLNSSNAALATTDLDAKLQAVRAQTLTLIAPLTLEDCQVQSMPDASPTKWHLAHTTWFFETFILERYESGFVPFDAQFRVLFNSYYNGIGAKHPRSQRGLVTRPSLQQVMAYRAQVEARMAEVLAAHPHDTELNTLVTLGINHEQQHQELILTDLKHLLSCNPAQPAYAQRWPLVTAHPQPFGWHGFNGGAVEIGFKSRSSVDNAADVLAEDGAFCFDNETPRHTVWLKPFELASRPVTYGDFAKFIEDNGYRRPELWLSMGWDWVQLGSQAKPRSMPLYWRKQDEGRANDFANFTLQGDVAIEENTPVCHLSYFEADAYARWAAQSGDAALKGARLPTEQEWEHAARSSAALHMSPAGNFLESKNFHPVAQRQAVQGPAQLFGDVWEWTQSNYNPYPGYAPWAGAVGEYNGKFMCNQFVLRGGSCVTPQSHIRASYRNFFPPDAQWQFSGMRLARDA
jgi:ergothioneine biosynthesis protein EgtB